MKNISTTAQKKETKQHLLSLPDKSSKNGIYGLTVKNQIKMNIPNQISAIAKIIRQDWQKIYFGAVPYLKAMEQIENIDGRYYEDSAESIVRYFLGNAKTWRGEVAKAVKAKLNNLLKECQ